MFKRDYKLIKDLKSEIKHIKLYAENMIEKFGNDTYVVDGIIRWKSNKRIPPIDILSLWEHVGKPFNCEKSLLIQNNEDNIFIQEYIKNQSIKVFSSEEISEMRSAFGSNAVVVNVITGEKIDL